MTKLVFDYFNRLSAAFGGGWTRFWFTPSDPTVLSAIRLAVGVLAVYLHATLFVDLVPLFGPNGLLPAREIAPLEFGAFSYLNYVSTPGELWTVHTIGLVVLVLFTAGWWTRWMSLGALIVFLSDVNRALMITGRTEPIVAMLLAYLCLAPSGARFSLDHWLARRRQPQLVSTPPPLSTTATIATRLIQVHLALLVAMMGFSKLTGDVWWSGVGAWWLMARPESRLVDLTSLYESPKAVYLWTHAIVFFELCFPLLIWIPLARPLLLAAGVLVWASIALITADITFAVAMCIASLAFVSPGVISRCCRTSDS